VAATRPLPVPDPAAGPSRQAEHYAVLLARAFETGDRAKLNRCASEYPGTEHPLAVRRLAAAVRVAAQCLVDLLDGTAAVVEGHVAVVVVDADGPRVEARPVAEPVALRRAPQGRVARPERPRAARTARTA
jgi:hypothetical protein